MPLFLLSGNRGVNIKKIKEPFFPKGKRFFYFLQFGIYSFIMGVAGERSLVVSKQCLYVMNSPLFWAEYPEYVE